MLSLVKSYPWKFLEVSQSCADQVVGILTLPPSLKRKRQRSLRGWQGLHRRQFSHQFRFREALGWHSNKLFTSFRLTDERDGIRIKANFNASTSKLLPDGVLSTSQTKDPVAATAKAPPPLLKIPPHVFETQEVFFPWGLGTSAPSGWHADRRAIGAWWESARLGKY